MRKLINGIILLICGFMVSHTTSTFKGVDPVEDIAPHVVAWRLLSKGNERFATGFHFKWNNEEW